MVPQIDGTCPVPRKESSPHVLTQGTPPLPGALYAHQPRPMSCSGVAPLPILVQRGKPGFGVTRCTCKLHIVTASLSFNSPPEMGSELEGQDLCTGRDCGVASLTALTSCSHRSQLGAHLPISISPSAEGDTDSTLIGDCERI